MHRLPTRSRLTLAALVAVRREDQLRQTVTRHILLRLQTEAFAHGAFYPSLSIPWDCITTHALSVFYLIEARRIVQFLREVVVPVWEGALGGPSPCGYAETRKWPCGDSENLRTDLDQVAEMHGVYS